MDTLNTTVIGAHATLSLSSYHRWNALSPSLMSENDDDNNEMKACGPVKIKYLFDSDDQVYFSSNLTSTTTQQHNKLINHRDHQHQLVIPTIPLASCATATAFLSFAFNRRLVSSNRNVSFRKIFETILNYVNGLYYQHK
ncbi:unnamed protein product [Onchocerca flexuosa]|uniref:Uncharacterized protein n=1 Tax=Onchocerca flexuosa TaxID=387005 RepID=A0A183HYG4_9BILA|nr:unnamed protein product [Onchocerca flexuosa]